MFTRRQFLLNWYQLQIIYSSNNILSFYIFKYFNIYIPLSKLISHRCLRKAIIKNTIAIELREALNY